MMSCEICHLAPCGRTTLCPPGTYYVIEPSTGTAVESRRIILPPDVKVLVTRAFVKLME